MAKIFKPLKGDDITNTRTLLHEAIPLTGSLVSGTYGTWPDGTNIKNYAHGMFQSIYDYPYLSSSANHIFDLSVGYSSDSALSGVASIQNAKKINMYNQMASVLQGHDVSGNILNFDQDGDILSGGTKIRECVFVNFARLLSKDEIKKGSFTMKLGGEEAFANPMNSLLTITDSGAENNYKVNSPSGEYGILSCSAGGAYSGSEGRVGLLFYQAGVAVLSASVFQSGGVGGSTGGVLGQDAVYLSNGDSVSASFTGSSISGSCDAFRHRIYDISFNNTTELNSSIYFCRVNNNEFNYSSSPTYLSSSKIRVKNNQLDQPISYVTTVGLYSDNNELLAVAKLSEPLKKDPSNEMTIRVRLDY